MTALDRSIAPAIHSMGPIPIPQASTMLLPNGITLRTLGGACEPVCRLSVITQGGSVEAGVAGLATMSAVAQRKGIATMDARQLAETIESAGAFVNASANAHHRALTLQTITRSVEPLLPVLLQLCTSPTFPAGEIAELKQLRMRAIEQTMQRVTWQASAALSPLIYGADSSLGHSTLPSDIEALTPEAMSRFFTHGLATSNITVTLSGQFDHRLVQTVAEAFSTIASKGFGYDRADEQISPQSPQRVDVDMPHAVQSAVKIAIPTIGRHHADFIALKMAVIALGGYFGSRLMANIREEKGLTYGINSSVTSHSDMSVINITAQTSPECVEQVIDEVRNELLRLADPSTYTLAELDRLQRQLLSGMAELFETPLTAMSTFESVWANGQDADYYTRQEQQIRALTPDILASAARKYINPDTLYIAAAGPKTKK